MSSVRESILVAIAGKLVTANVADGRVYRTRREQIETLPAVEVELGGANAEELARGAMDHRMTVEVRALAKGDTPDTAADPVLLAAHAALMADLTLGLGNGVQLMPRFDADPPEVEAYDYARVTHRYTVTYRTDTGAF